MKMYLDTSESTVILELNDVRYEEDLGRDMAEKLLGFIHEKLESLGADWHDISKITFMSGPGSFTGLRIGAAIVNTLARDLNIPLYDHHRVPHSQIIPNYGRGANISKPVK